MQPIAASLRFLGPALAISALLVSTGAVVGTPPAAASSAVAAEPVNLTSLEVEKKAEPVGVDVDRPRFSWVIETSARAVTQESYRLRVAAASEGLDGDLTWDSGVVDSDESANVAYDGPRLESAAGYVWGVEVVTTAGAAAATSSFRTGLLDAADWGESAWIGNDRPRADGEVTLQGASWIHPPYTETNTPPGYFRATFAVDPDRPIQSAELVMTGDLGFSAFLNGMQVASGPSTPDAWKKAARVEVAPRPGANLLAVRLNNTAKAYAAVVGKLVLRYADGTTSEVTTDDSWLSSRTANPGWHLGGYDTTGWVAAAERATYGSGPWGAQVVVPDEPTPDVSMNLDTSSWIIPDIGAPSTGNPIPSTLFRRAIPVAADKQVAWAQLAITGDQVFTAYWNGEQVAANTGANNEWQQARTVNLPAVPGDNVLAVSLRTPGTSQYGGVLARVRVVYTDGTSEDVVTDRDTLAQVIGSGTAPDGWTTVDYDDSSWQPARAQALYRGWVYGDRVTVPQLANGTESLSLEGARWIWTPEATSPVAPAEDRVFRATRTSPDGREATEADVLITADDSFRLFVNGSFVGATEGATNEWQQSHLYPVDLEAERNVFAVRTSNGPGSPAGLIAAVRMHYDDGSSEVFTTDTSWKAAKEIAADFADPAFDDSAWGAAAVQAIYGGAPWSRNVKPPKDDVAPAPLLRKEFEVASQVSNATIYVAAGGYADVSINGDPISDDVLSPGFTDYDDTVQYVATDVTEQLDQGQNALGMELGRGFYGMTGGNVWNWNTPPWHDEPVARAVLEIEYADGSVDRVVTDGSWTIHDGPTRFDDLYGGETYDAGRLQTGYDTPGFDDATWPAASEVRGPRGVLVSQRQQPIRVTESLPAVEITEPVDGTYVVKFPRVLAGWVEVTAEGAAGTTIRYQYGEKLLANGLVNFSNNGGFQSGFQTDRFVLAGTGEPETWEPRFSYKGFQYIQVTGWPGDESPPLSAFAAKAVHTDAPRTGSFESSSEVMNRTHEAVVDTLYNNIHGIPTDTPMFEKNGWTGDAAIGAEMFMLNLDVHELFAKWMRDVHETRDAQGAPMVIAPSSGSWGEWGVAPPWHSAYVMIPWWLYQYGGDDRVLTELYDGMKRYVDLEFGRSSGGIVSNPRLGDWVSPEASPAGSNAPEDTRVSGTAYLYAMLTSMQRSAEHLGKPADAAHFAESAAVVKDAFNDAFLDAGAGRYRGNASDRGYRQTHNVLALAFGLAPDAETAQRVADSIAADVEAKGVHLNTGVLGTKYLLPVLTEHGHADLAYQLAVQTTYPSWGYMLEQGATSMWEHWSAEARSRGHYFLGTVDDWFYKYAAGIRPSEESGYREVTIAPAVTAELDWARATTDTPYGPVTSDWRRDGQDLALDVTIPVGSVAEVRIPAENAAAVVEGGRLAAQAEGVSDASFADGQMVLTVGSGHYEFRVEEHLAIFGRVLDRIAEAQDRADLHHTAGDLASDDHAALSEGLGRVDDDVADAIAAVLADDDAAASARLDEALQAARKLRADTERGAIDPPVRHDLVRHLDRVVAALESVISHRLGVSVTVAPLADGALPGEQVKGTVAVTNTGVTPLVGLVAQLAVDDWTVDESGLELATLDPQASAMLPFTATVPIDASLGEREAAVTLEYTSGGETYSVSGAGPWVTVTSGVEVTGVAGAVPDPASPERGLVTVSVDNTGIAPVDGRVELTAPAGWPATAPSRPITVPAGASVEVELPVVVPRRVVATSYSFTATFVRGDDELAEGSGQLAVALPTPPEDAVDHVDFGETSSETAHAVQASASSGTSVEAGLTRRYAHSLFPGSWYSAEVKVPTGEPFVVRMIETFDGARTKEFNLYADEVLVGRYDITRTEGGNGWLAHQLVVDTEDAVAATADGSVRLKFEFPVDATDYDPSIADVWVLPATADDLPPIASVRVDGATPGRNGWQRGPAEVSVVAVDNRAGEPVVEIGGDAGWAPYTGPVWVAGDGTHAVDYRARDEAGNSTGARSAEVRIDATPPSTVLSVARGSGLDGSDRADLRLEATDATSGVVATQYRVDGGAWRTLGAETPTVDGFGEHVVEFLSTDVAGNNETLRRVAVTLADVEEVAPVVGPQVSGTAEFGRTLRASPGSWNTKGLTLRYQWLRDGTPVRGATTATYRLGGRDIGSRLSVRVTATKPGLPAGSATSATSGAVRKAAAYVDLTTRRPSAATGRPISMRVEVTSPSASPSGKVVIRVDGRKVRTVRVTGSPLRVSITLADRGTHRVRAIYRGSSTVTPARSPKLTLRAR